jgi:hypothetical protein
LRGSGSYIKLEIDDDIFTLDYDRDTGAYEAAENYFNIFVHKKHTSLAEVEANNQHMTDLIGILQYQKRHIESHIEHAIETLQNGINLKSRYLNQIIEEA